MKNVLAILLILVSVGLFYVFISPAYTEIQAKLLEQSSYRTTIENSKLILGIRDEISNKYNEVSLENLDRLNKLLPNQINNVRLIIEVDSIAALCNMGIKDVRLDLKNATDQMNQETLEVITTEVGTGGFGFKISGTYDEFKSFIQRLEESLRIIDVKSIGFTATAPTADQSNIANVYDFSVSLDTYWLKEKK